MNPLLQGKCTRIVQMDAGKKQEGISQAFVFNFLEAPRSC
jgi:hypothetical protein